MYLLAWGALRKRRYYAPVSHHAIVTSKNVFYPGYNNLLTTGTDDPTLWLSFKHQQGW